MNQRLLLLPLLFLLTSCATFMNGPATTTTIYTDKPATIIVNRDTLQTRHNKLELITERNKKPINLIIITDSIKKFLSIPAKNSFAYYYNIPCNCGIGMLAERNNPKRYTHLRRIFLNSSDTLNQYFRYRKPQKGELHLHLSLPWVNSFRLKPINETTKWSFGFWGASVGADYHHSKYQFLNVSASGVTDFLVPVPAPVDYSGEYEITSSTYMSASNNHRIGAFSAGYGLSFSRNTWQLLYSGRFGAPPPSRAPVKKTNYTLGLVLPFYYHTAKAFNLGLIYRPTFIQLNSVNRFQYEHLISIDFAWKIPLKKID